MKLRVTTRTAPAWVALASGVFLVAFSLDFPGSTAPNDPGAAALPRMAGTGLIALSMLQLALGQPDGDDSEPLPRGGDGWRVAGLTSLLVGYVYLFPTVGFMEGAALFLFAAMLIGGARSPWLLLGIPLGVSALMGYVFYSVLRVSLPLGPIGELLLL